MQDSERGKPADWDWPSETPAEPTGSEPDAHAARDASRRGTQPRSPAGPPAAHLCADRAREHAVPVRVRRDDQDRRGPRRAAQHRSGAASGHRHHPAGIRLPQVRGRRHSGAGARAPRRGRAAHRRHARPCSGAEVRGPASAVSSIDRQSQIFACSGIELHRSTLSDWVGTALFHLRPVFDYLKAELETSSTQGLDETTVRVLDPGRGKTRAGYMWTMERGERAWCGADPPGVVYDYAPSRSGLGAVTRPDDGGEQPSEHAASTAVPATRCVSKSYASSRVRVITIRDIRQGPAAGGGDRIRRRAGADLRRVTRSRCP